MNAPQHIRLMPAAAPCGARCSHSTAAPGLTIWLTGLPCSGKSTLAQALAARIHAAGLSTEVLDGDELRASISPGLGFSRADRDANVRRIAFIARLLARNGVIALVPVIAPFEQARAAARMHHESDGIPYFEVHVSTAVEICESRDVKGLYARQRTGAISGLTGVDGVYEVPQNPDLRIDTTAKQVQECVDTICSALVARGLL